MRPLLRLGLPLGVLLIAAGCFRTTVRSGLPPADAAARHDDNWHSGLLLGSIETSGPYALREICPEGWAEVNTSTNLLQGML